MAKPQLETKHAGSTLLWSGDLKTICGLRLPKGTFRKERWFFESPANVCPGCYYPNGKQRSR